MSQRNLTDPRLEPINPKSLGPPSGYSHGMLAPPQCRLLFIAGQIGWGEDQELVGDDFHSQFSQAMANVIEVVRGAGGRPEDVAQLTVFVVDRQEYLDCREEIGEAYQLMMGRHYPAMSLVEVQSLLETGAKVEIQGLAAIPPRRRTFGESSGIFDLSEVRKKMKGGGKSA